MTAASIIRATCLATCIAVPAAPALAKSCTSATTTRDMIECARTDFDLADGDLNRAYQEKLAQEDKDGKSLLRKAQRAWIVFRDAECARQADFARGGTMAPLLGMTCLTSLTVRRVNELSHNPVTGEIE